MKKIRIFAVILICFILLTSCTKKYTEESLWEDTRYSDTFVLFTSDRYREEGDSLNSLLARYPTLKEILWLETLPEEIPDDTLIYFPSRYSQIRLDNMNGIIQDKNLDLSGFGLSYPITMQDILNKHEAMRKLVGSLDEEDKDRFENAEPEEAQAWRRTTMYAYKYGINNNRDVTNFYSGLSVDYNLYREILWLEELPADVEDDVMVFYATEKTTILANNLTKAAEKDQLNLDDYGLSNPITVRDILTKHDAMSNLRGDLKEETDEAYFTSKKLW
jgi:hypothetical protein